MSDSPQTGDQGQPQQSPKFNPDAPNQQRPKLRPVRGFAAKQGEQALLGIMDAQQISQKVVFTIPAAQVILPHMTGENDLDQIVEKVGQGLTRPMLEQLIAQLNDAGLIEGPVFEQMRDAMRREFDSADNLPPGATAQFADTLAAEELGEDAGEEQKREVGATRLRQKFDEWIDQALRESDKPSFDALPRGVIAPQLDYPRGWVNYANVYGRMRVVDRPDRVIILGANHFGSGSGVVGCDKGYESPLGLCPLAEDFKSALDEALGAELRDRLYEHRYDHEREHSIELHIPWIQHVFADAEGRHPSVYAALAHDPSRNSGESYDGQGVGIDPFVDALRTALEQVDGRTLLVASVDLSHIGPQFGDQVPMRDDNPQATSMRDQAMATDREMLEMYSQGRADELIASMAWRQNPTRWCSLGAMTAIYKALEPAQVDILHYNAAVDAQGSAMVSSIAAAIR